MKEKIKMSIKEADRLGVMRRIDKKILTIKKASEELGISERQTKRVRQRYLKEGVKGLISLKRGKESNRKIPEKIRNKVISLLKTKYLGFGATFASEKLKERNKIIVSIETVRKWLIEEELWKPKRKKEQRVYQRRTRRSRFGELLQGDGSPHDWFENGEKYTLLQFVDDATSKTTVARLVLSETTENYLDLLKDHLEKYGRPLGLYVDKHSVFRVNHTELKNGSGITHFGRVMKDLDIELICANSPQAKGRVERKNGVFQDRLVKEMKLRNIKTIEEANVFLPRFLEEINNRFGKEAANPEDAHRRLRTQDDLLKIFAHKDTRKLSKDLTFQHRGITYMIQTKNPNRMRHAIVEILIRKDSPIDVLYDGEKLAYKKWAETIYEQPKMFDRKEMVTYRWSSRKPKKPGKHHPWR